MVTPQKEKLSKEKVAKKGPAKAPEIKVKPAEKVQADKKKAPVTEVFAAARFVHVAPRKARLVINELKGKTADEALNKLYFIKQSAVLPIIKLINSAIANAEHNFQLNRKDLYIKKFIANPGPAFKRWQQKAFGRASSIYRKTSHLEITLAVKPGVKVPARKQATSADAVNKAAEDVKIVNPDEVKKMSNKSSDRQTDQQGRGQRGFLKKVFNRKTG